MTLQFSILQERNPTKSVMAISTADRPFYFTNLKAGDGVSGIADFIVSLGGLPDGSNAMESTAL